MAPGFRFLWGSSLLVLFLLQHEPVVKLLLVVLFAILARIAGKRIRYGYFAILLVTVTLFNLLSPYGVLIATLGPLRITEGALLSGVTKGLTIVGLVFVSLFSVSRHLVLPGRFGLFLGRSLFYFQRLYGEKKRLRRGHIIEDIDAILEGLSTGAAAAQPERPVLRTTRRGALLALVLFLAVGGSLFLPARPFD